MITPDFTKFTNKNNWHVVHNPDSQLFYLKNSNGNRRPGTYTTRVFAEQALYNYLNDLSIETEKVEQKKAEKKAINRGPQKKQLTPGREREAAKEAALKQEEYRNATNN